MSQLIHLESLHLSDNLITELPDWMQQLLDEEILFISGNPVAD
jgi:Leucine-rich repeat (LRR) protein